MSGWIGSVISVIDRAVHPSLASRPEARFRARLLVAFASLLALCALILGGAHVCMGIWGVGSAVLGGGLLMLGTHALVYRWGAISLATHWVLGNLATILFLVCLAVGGAEPYTLMWLPLVPLAAVVMGGVRESVIWAGLAGLEVAVLFGLQIAGFDFPTPPPGPPVLDMLGMWMIIGLTFGFAVLYANMNATLHATLVAKNVEVDRAMKTAEAATRTKSAFIANISHEIRTPMNGVIGMSEALLASSLDDDQRDAALTLQSCADTLLRLINDVLDFSKGEAHKTVIEDIAFSLEKTAQSVASAFAGRAEQRGLALIVEVEPDFPASLSGDPTRLQQILFNLVGNAIKFTERGTVRLSIAVSHREPEQTLVEMIVRDTGMGISPEQQALLFQPFAQADASTTRRFGGTGLGLAIAKQLTEAMRGTIVMSSRLGEGSSFQVLIPLRNVAAIPPREVVADPVEREPGPILLVEDNPVNRKVATRMLERCGLGCDVARNGTDAVNAVSDRPYRLILMDCQMPEMDGYEATREIRRREEGTSSRVRIVALTANAVAGDRERCLAAGMDDYLAKPITSAKLGEILRDARLV